MLMCISVAMSASASILPLSAAAAVATTVVLIDSRRGPKEIDFDWMCCLREGHVPFKIVSKDQRACDICCFSHDFLAMGGGKLCPVPSPVLPLLISSPSCLPASCHMRRVTQLKLSHVCRQVLTKVDKVNMAQRSEAEEACRMQYERICGSVKEEDIIVTSTKTGEGMLRLKEALANVLRVRNGAKPVTRQKSGCAGGGTGAAEKDGICGEAEQGGAPSGKGGLS
jgi:hypothetical protein